MQARLVVPMTEDPLESKRPHMVMVVGNRVIGDSRVEKAAITAHQAGYRVTVLGLKHRTVPPFGVIGEVPVYRVGPEYHMYNAWQLGNDEENFELRAQARLARQRLRHLHAEGVSLRNRAHRAVLRVAMALLWVMEKAATSVDGRRLARARRLAVLPIPGVWRRAWPLIADLELAFTTAMLELQPDIVHVHDRDAMPAARTVAGLRAADGHVMRWVYDAHEWLPGVHFTGPEVNAAAWRAAEAELIRHADAVIAVSDELAEKLRASHELRERPTVVANAPFSVRVPDESGSRRTVREECGLDDETCLLVYVGRVEKRRGLETVIRSLPQLADVHFAAVAPPDLPPRTALRELAIELGVSDRLHILDYVPAASVTWYISSATVGVSPLEHNEAHHLILATKVREYFHAGLPIVGSDVRAQARLLTETGVGAVHRAGDADDCARAIADVLADLDSYRSAITPDLLAEHSWERQEKTLKKVWVGLMGSRAPQPRSARYRPHLLMGPVVEEARSRRLLAAVCAETGGTAELLSRPGPKSLSDAHPIMSQGVGLGAVLEEYRHLVAHSDGLILEGFTQLFGGFAGDVESELSHLLEVRPLAALLDPVALRPPDEVIEDDPDSWMLALDDEGRTRIARQSRHTRGLLGSVGLPLLVTAAQGLAVRPDATWVPTCVPITEQRQSREGPLRVFVAPGPRGGRDALVPEAVQAAAGSAITIVRPTPEDDTASILDRTDVLVDQLGYGGYTDLAAQAMGASCAVLSRLSHEMRTALPHPCPVVDVAPDEVTDALADLARDRDRWNRLGDEGLSYVREVHDGRRSAAIVIEALGL